MTKDLVDLKRKKRTKNPKFVRQDANKKKRLSKKWRKPRGEHSKQRLRMRNQPVVSPGYGTPKEVKGKHFSGIEIVHISSIGQIEKIDPKKQGVIVSGRIGLRKKLPLLKELIKKKIKILNIPDAEEYIRRKEQHLKRRKETKQKEEKKEAKEKKEEKKKKEDSIDDKVTEEEKKKIEKKEIDKLLTKKR